LKTPKELQPLLDDGIIDGVLRRLKSGKEATVYLVDCGGRIRCAKVYKDSQQRGFHKLAEYQEGRTVRGSRDTRALGKGGKHGRSVQEAQWKNAEVEALKRRKFSFPMTAAPAIVPASGAKNKIAHKVPLREGDHGIHAIQALVKNRMFPPNARAMPIFNRVFAVIQDQGILSTKAG
jgi:hypothetical protein